LPSRDYPFTSPILDNHLLRNALKINANVQA
jgi:hypothetical protein